MCVQLRTLSLLLYQLPPFSHQLLLIPRELPWSLSPNEVSDYVARADRWLEDAKQESDIVRSLLHFFQNSRYPKFTVDLDRPNDLTDLASTDAHAALQQTAAPQRLSVKINGAMLVGCLHRWTPDHTVSDSNPDFDALRGVLFEEVLRDMSLFKGISTRSIRSGTG